MRIKMCLALLLVLAACTPLPIAEPTPTLTATPKPPTPTFTPWPTSTRAPTFTPVPTVYYKTMDWRELNVFLAADHTNWRAYVKDEYICVDFALDLVESAAKRDIKAWIVGVMFDRSDIGHAFVAFGTSDLGEVWIEPQSDYAYNAVEVGMPLCYAIDTSICENWGKVTEINEPMQCDHDSKNCWVE